MQTIARVAFTLVFLFGLNFSSIPAQEKKPDFGEWKTTAGFKNPRVSHQTVLYGNCLYVTGGYMYSPASGEFKLYDDVEFAALNEDGTISPNSWKQTKSFNGARSGHGSAIYKNYVYIIGGAKGDGTNFQDIQYAQIEVGGEIKQWATSPGKLNVPKSNPSVFVHETKDGRAFIYVVGGVGDLIKSNNLTVHFDYIEYAQINKDGSLGEWKLAPFHFKGGRSAPATIVYNNRLYVIGGWGDLDEDIFSDVQYCDINEDGSLGRWRTSQSGLKFGVYGHTSLLIYPDTAPTVLVLGGNGGLGNTFSSVQHSRFEQGGKLAEWAFSPKRFVTPRWGHTSVFWNGKVYVLGGYNQDTLNDVQFAPVSYK